MRTLTITTNPDWKTMLRDAGKKATSGLESGEYQGETLNFATPGLFFSNLSGKRWNLLKILLGSGRVGLRELARQAGRDVKGVSNDATALIQLGLIEKDEKGGLICPYEKIHISMDVEASRNAA
jgi:predicted transcriptional regulator